MPSWRSRSRSSRRSHSLSPSEWSRRCCRHWLNTSSETNNKRSLVVSCDWHRRRTAYSGSPRVWRTLGQILALCLWTWMSVLLDDREKKKKFIKTYAAGTFLLCNWERMAREYHDQIYSLCFLKFFQVQSILCWKAHYNSKLSEQL